MLFAHDLHQSSTSSCIHCIHNTVNQTYLYPLLLLTVTAQMDPATEAPRRKCRTVLQYPKEALRAELSSHDARGLFPWLARHT